MTNPIGRRRHPDYVTTWGEKLPGIYMGKDGRLRPQGLSKPAYGGDEKLAAHKIKMWMLKNNPSETAPKAASEVSAMTPRDYDGWVSKGRTLGAAALDDPDGHLAAIYTERERIRTLILTNPKQAATELRIPYLADYPATPTKPQFTLTELLAEYLKHKRNKRRQPLQAKYKANLSTWWTDFLERIGNPRYARDISRSSIAQYYREIGNATVKDPNTGKQVPASPAYIKSRFATVKALLQYGIDFTDDHKDYRAALDCCGILAAPTQEAQPDPITPEHFSALLNVARPRDKAILLLGLNLAAHGGEVATIRMSEIDLNAKTYVADRNKTGIPRVAKLWDRTVQAVREYRATDKRNHSDYLFVSQRGRPHTSHNVQQTFQTLRTNAGIPETVTFESIRDGAYLQAFRVSPIYARWVGGHASWTKLPSESKDITNVYVKRDPNDPNVIACCEAIERHYFPETAQGGR